MVSTPLPLEGALNVRDLGGYETDRGKTRSHVFLRADNLAALTEGDLTFLREYGVTCAVDLRAQLERESSPDPLERQPLAEYHSVPMLDQLNSRNFEDKFPDTMGQVYLDLLEGSGPAFARLAALLAQAQGCALFHCTAGKDRTGVTALLLLDLAGVSRQDIAEDYAVTEQYMKVVINAQLRRMEMEGIYGKEYLYRSQPQDILQAYDHLQEKYGGARGYLAHVGCGEDILTQLEKKLLG